MVDSLTGMALGEANRGREMKVFDWHRAAELIKERQPERASAGLSGDWEWTGGPIYEDGEPIPENETYTYLASTWATPELRLDDELIDCYKMESQTPGWNSGTYWPESALEILNVEHAHC